MNFSAMELAALSGRFFMFGLESTTLKDIEKKYIIDDKISGVILFARNLENREQLKNLMDQLDKATPYKILKAIDQEGGRVCRFNESFNFDNPESMRDVGKKYSYDQIFNIAYKMGKDLKDLGFNIDFAPVLDIDTNPDNPIIAERSFGSDWESVVKYGEPFLKGMQKAEILNCGKHFPGHGDTVVDSHKDLPVGDDSMDDLMKREMIPFQKLTPYLDSIMSAHILFPKVDKLPATLSKKFINGALRDQIGFDKVVFSDDLIMKAIKDRYSLEEIVYNGLNSGVDIFIVAENESGIQEEIIEVTKSLILSKEIPFDTILKSIVRIDKMINRY